MVAGTHHTYFIVLWPHPDIRCFYRVDSFYLFPFLKMKRHFKDLFTTSVACLLLYYFSQVEFVLWIGLSYLILCLFIPVVDSFNHKAWLTITHFLQKIMNPVLMAIIFFLFLTPIAILSRVFKKKTPKTNSTFKEVDWKDNNFEEGW